MAQGDKSAATVPLAEYEMLRRELDALRSNAASPAAKDNPVKVLDEARIRGILSLRQSLAGSIAEKTDDQRIATEVRTFRVVVTVLDDLIAIGARCAGPTCHGWSADGVRRLVPIAQLEAERARADQAQREIEALRTELALSRTDSFRF